MLNVVRRVYRPSYMVDTWSEADWMLMIVSPTTEFNTARKGPDELFYDLLKDANQLADKQSLGLTRAKLHPKLDDHFHTVYGVEYGLSAGHRRTAAERAKIFRSNMSVVEAETLMGKVLKEEMAGYMPDETNSVQVHAYLEGMHLDWHTDGYDDLGNTMTTLSLGGDAELLIRASEPSENPTVNHDEDARSLAVNRIPLIHGSIVVMYGSFDQRFEHKIENHGPLRFAITLRHVDEAARTRQVWTREDTERRFNGQWFISSDEESSDEEPPVRPEQPGRPVRAAKPVAKPSAKKRARPEPDSESPSPSPPRKGRRTSGATAPGFKEPGWTQHQKDQIYNWRMQQYSYEQIAVKADTGFGLQGKVKKENLRMVVNREKKRRAERARLLGEGSRASSIAPSDSASGLADIGDQPGQPNAWSKDEIDRLLAYRAQDPQLTYKQIRAKENNKRTEKAYREQIATLNKKKRNDDSATPSGQSGADHGPPTTRHSRKKDDDDEMDVDDSDDDGDDEGPVGERSSGTHSPPPPPPQNTRNTRVSRSRAAEPSASTRASRASQVAAVEGPVSADADDAMQGLNGPWTGRNTRASRTRSSKS
jgi:alkylated DNA repair dioxygenase AlkB